MIYVYTVNKGYFFIHPDTVAGLTKFQTLHMYSRITDSGLLNLSCECFLYYEPLCLAGWEGKRSHGCCSDGGGAGGKGPEHGEHLSARSARCRSNWPPAASRVLLNHLRPRCVPSTSRELTATIAFTPGSNAYRNRFGFR